MAKIFDKGLIAKKVGMTRMVDDAGRMIAVTVLEVADQRVTKVLTPERDGYHGVQLGFFRKSEKNLNKPDLARLRKAGVEDNYARFQEFRTPGPVEALSLSSKVSAELFDGIAQVDVTGQTKGRGFQGAVKRWNSSIGRMTHGSRFHRRPGSLGQCTTPGRVYKNKPQPGHMGTENRTVRNMKVMKIDATRNLIAVKGSVPGTRNGYLEVRPSIGTGK
ncbi:MAG: 50S ribosomal protein L3 [Oligoflexales bacterium]